MSIIVNHNFGKVWRHHGGNAQWMLRREQLDWLTPQQICRAERLRQAKMLFEGDHRGYFVDEGRSAFEFPEIRANAPRFYRPLNLLTLVSRKTADLLFGESCRISIDDATMQAVIDQIVDRSWLNASLPAAATECSWAGETYLEITRQGGNARIGHAPAEEIFPLGEPGPDQQHGGYVRYSVADVGGENGSMLTRLLLEVYYLPGKIVRKVWAIGTLPTGAVARTNEVSIDRWPVKIGDVPLPAEELTGLTRCSLVRVPNGHDATSDYDGLIEQQDDLSAKQTQIARVLAKHADPRLYMPTSAQDPTTGNVAAGAEVFFGNDKTTDKPEYITWNAELAAAIDDRKFALLGFATMAEMPLSLLGIKDDSTAETASKMRLNAATALAKAARVASYWQGALRLAISIAIEAETGSVPGKAIGVEMRDGLPVDEKERAEVITMLRGAKSMSLRRSLEAQYLDPTDIDQEVEAIQDETKAEMPSTLMSEPGTNETTTVSSQTAGIVAEQTLNGAQINAAIDVIGQMQAGAIGRLTAIEMLTAVGIERTRAVEMVTDSGARSGAGVSTAVS